MSVLNKAEEVVLKNMEDHRFVFPDYLEKAFFEKGLCEFIKFVIEHNKTAGVDEKLAVLLRGNNDSIIIYENNHKIWELSLSEKVCKVSFNFDHARYTQKWPQKLAELKKLGFVLPTHDPAKMLSESSPIMIVRNKKGMVTGGSIGVISCTKPKFSKDFVKGSYKIIHELQKDFFKEQLYDFFRLEVAKKYPEAKDVNGAGSNEYVEKRWQQRLFFHFNDMNTGYYAYDLEFSQKYPDSEFVKKYAKKNGQEYASVKAKEIKQKLGGNEPDILAIRYENWEPKALVFIEVKSTKTACESKSSGVKSHMEGMSKYSKEPILMKKRRIDAYKSLQQYKSMGLINKSIDIKSIPENLPIKNVLLFTNAKVSEKGKKKPNSLDFFKNNWKDIEELSKKNKCEVWITKNNYWDETISIDMKPFEHIDKVLESLG